MSASFLLSPTTTDAGEDFPLLSLSADARTSATWASPRGGAAAASPTAAETAYGSNSSALTPQASPRCVRCPNCSSMYRRRAQSASSPMAASGRRKGAMSRSGGRGGTTRAAVAGALFAASGRSSRGAPSSSGGLGSSYDDLVPFVTGGAGDLDDDEDAAALFSMSYHEQSPDSVGAAADKGGSHPRGQAALRPVRTETFRRDATSGKLVHVRAGGDAAMAAATRPPQALVEKRVAALALDADFGRSAASESCDASSSSVAAPHVTTDDTAEVSQRDQLILLTHTDTRLGRAIFAKRAGESDSWMPVWRVVWSRLLASVRAAAAIKALQRGRAQRSGVELAEDLQRGWLEELLDFQHLHVRSRIALLHDREAFDRDTIMFLFRRRMPRVGRHEPGIMNLDVCCRRVIVDDIAASYVEEGATYTVVRTASAARAGEAGSGAEEQVLMTEFDCNVADADDPIHVDICGPGGSGNDDEVVGGFNLRPAGLPRRGHAKLVVAFSWNFEGAEPLVEMQPAQLRAIGAPETMAAVPEPAADDEGYVRDDRSSLSPSVAATPRETEHGVPPLLVPTAASTSVSAASPSRAHAVSALQLDSARSVTSPQQREDPRALRARSRQSSPTPRALQSQSVAGAFRLDTAAAASPSGYGSSGALLRAYRSRCAALFAEERAAWRAINDEWELGLCFATLHDTAALDTAAAGASPAPLRVAPQQVHSARGALPAAVGQPAAPARQVCEIAVQTDAPEDVAKPRNGLTASSTSTPRQHRLGNSQRDELPPPAPAVDAKHRRRELPAALADDLSAAERLARRALTGEFKLGVLALIEAERRAVLELRQRAGRVRIVDRLVETFRLLRGEADYDDGPDAQQRTAPPSRGSMLVSPDPAASPSRTIGAHSTVIEWEYRQPRTPSRARDELEASTFAPPSRARPRNVRDPSPDVIGAGDLPPIPVSSAQRHQQHQQLQRHGAVRQQRTSAVAVENEKSSRRPSGSRTFSVSTGVFDQRSMVVIGAGFAGAPVAHASHIAPPAEPVRQGGELRTAARARWKDAVSSIDAARAEAERRDEELLGLGPRRSSRLGAFPDLAPLPIGGPRGPALRRTSSVHSNGTRDPSPTTPPRAGRPKPSPRPSPPGTPSDGGALQPTTSELFDPRRRLRTQSGAALQLRAASEMQPVDESRGHAAVVVSARTRSPAVPTSGPGSRTNSQPPSARGDTSARGK